MGERNWFTEERDNTSLFGNYNFSDNPLGNDHLFQGTDAQLWTKTLKNEWEPNFKGAYGAP